MSDMAMRGSVRPLLLCVSAEGAEDAHQGKVREERLEGRQALEWRRSVAVLVVGGIGVFGPC